MNVKQMLLSCNKDVTAMMLFRLQGGLQFKDWEQFQKMYDAFYEKVAATEAVAGDFVILGSSYRSGTEEIHNVYAYTRSGLLFDFRRCQVWEQDWTEEQLVARLDLLEDSRMYYSMPYHCIMSSMSWEALLGAEVFEKNLRTFGHEWMAAIVIYKMIFTEHVQGNPTKDTSILSWIAEYRELLSYVCFTDAEHWNTVFVYAGVEGAGKTSISGILNKDCNAYIETTLTQAADLQYIRKAKSQGAYVHLIYAGLNALEEHLERIENRVRKGGKGADIAEVKRQFESRWDALECVLPYCHEVSFFDFTNGINLVGSYRYGEVSVTESGWRCDWFREWRQHHDERKKEKL